MTGTWGIGEDKRGQQEVFPIWSVLFAVLAAVVYTLIPEGAMAVGGRIITETPTTAPAAWGVGVVVTVALFLIYVGATTDDDNPFIRDSRDE